MLSIEALNKFLPTCLIAFAPGKINIYNKRTHIRIDEEPLKARRRAGLTTAVYTWNLYTYIVVRDALPAMVALYARKRSSNTACLASIRSSRGWEIEILSLRGPTTLGSRTHVAPEMHTRASSMRY